MQWPIFTKNIVREQDNKMALISIITPTAEDKLHATRCNCIVVASSLSGGRRNSICKSHV